MIGERITLISRRSGVQSPICAEIVGAVAISAASGPLSCAPSAMNSEPGLISNSWVPGRSAIGAGSQARAATGLPSRSAPTVVDTDVCTNRPETAMTGPRPHGNSMARVLLARASAAAIGAPSAPSTVISASPGGLSWSKPSAVRSITSSQSSRLIRRVSVTRGCSDTVCTAASGAELIRRTCGPSPRSTATRLG